MVRLRLRRVGRKKQPSYRIVAADKEAPRDGRFLEAVGFYNPRTEPETITLKEDRIYHWLGNGAQPSDSVARIFRTAGLDKRFERFKAGEKLETLLEESAAWQDSQNVTDKTRVDSPVKSKKKAAVVEAETEAPAVEAEAPVEEEASAEVEVEAEAENTAEAEVEEETPAEVEEEAPAEAEVEVEAEEEAEEPAEEEKDE